MKSIGMIVAAISALCLLITLNMSTSYDGLFNNLRLMQDKQNYVTVSSLGVLVGLALFFFSEKKYLNESENGAAVNHHSNFELSKKTIHRFEESEKNLQNDSYKLYLVEKYKISKNEVLNQFVLNSKIYETIGDVLNTAHNIELQESMEEEEKLRASSEKIAKNISVLSDQAKSYLEVILRNGYKLEETLIKNNSLIWIFQAKSNGSRFEINSIEELRSLASNFK